MSKEGDHHYVSQFHLRKWEGSDGKIMRWGRVAYNGNLTRKPVSSAGTAYVRGLYSLQYVLSKESQQIEEKVFGKIETEARPVLEKLINDQALTSDDRYWWAIYLNASMMRVPHVVQRLKESAERHAVGSLSMNHGEYLAAKGNASEATLMEWVKNNDPGRLANLPMRVLVGMLGKDDAIERFLQLNWIVRDVSTANSRLMIGDDPFRRVGDFFKPRTLISIPLSPTQAFFGTDAPDIVQHILRLAPRELIKASNIEELRAAKRFAYGEGERTFIDNHLLRSA